MTLPGLTGDNATWTAPPPHQKHKVYVSPSSSSSSLCRRVLWWGEKILGKKKKGKTEKTSHSHYYVSLGETRLALATFAFIAFNPFFLVFLLLCSMFSWLLLACSARKGQANRNGYFGATFNVMTVSWLVYGWIFMRGEIMFTLIVQFLV